MVEQSHHLHRHTVIQAPLSEVFDFFADAANLERITPPELQFRILTPLPITVEEGRLIDYRLKLYGMGFGWRTLISTWEPPFKFVDQQVRGPYRLWVHTHEFRETSQGTEMTDHVEYQLPFWPIGEIALPLVRRQVNRIFDYRQEVIQRVFA